MLATINCKPELEIYYHGSCTNGLTGDLLLPPSVTDTISETGRKKNLCRVFFTKDLGLARIYAGRAARSLGGEPTIYRVVNPIDTVELNGTAGATVYHAEWAFVEQLG